MASHPPAPLGYTGGRLDRAGARRHDAGWLAALRAHPAARVVPVWREKNLVADTAGAPRAAWLPAPHAAALAPADAWPLLGLDGDTPVFALDLSALDAERLAERVAALAPGAEFVDLRQVGAAMAADDAALLAYARGLAAWHRRSGFCGACGNPTTVEQAGHMRRCTDPACKAEIYPRTDPAVIMLVERPAGGGAPAQCLLARHTRLPARVWSTLAGFVEPGESLEEAVAREVLEETGVRVGRVAYRGSQPWPFPASLMVGYRARAETTAVTLDRAELAEARWFTAAELAEFGEWGDEGARARLPRRDSIARTLITDWVREQLSGAPS
ncbi:MAG TPA: NAD(+) diphosphatase [Gemmatimonadales bacterium]|nr:NAD(+) diphosphatase [Gemmatimonadales bacterium]